MICINNLRLAINGTLRSYEKQGIIVNQHFFGHTFPI